MTAMITRLMRVARVFEEREIIIKEDLECRENGNDQSHQCFSGYHPGCQQDAGVLDPYLLCTVQFSLFRVDVDNTLEQLASDKNGKCRSSGGSLPTLTSASGCGPA